MTNPVAIIGSGEHAAVIADMIKTQPHRWQLMGYFDSQPNPIFEQTFDKIKYLGTDSDYPSAKNQYPALHTILGIGRTTSDLATRSTIIDTYTHANAQWATITANSAIISKKATIYPNTVVMPGCIINANAVVGSNCIINSGAIVEHDVYIGSGTVVAPGVVIGGGTHIGHSATLGLGAKIRDHITLGDYVTVGMGATVVSDIDDGLTVLGTPATRKKG